MGYLMRCLYCGLLQDEPAGVKQCARCGGEMVFENERLKGQPSSYLSVQMELDQVYAPSEKMIDRFLLFSIQSPKSVPEAYQPQNQKKRPSINFNPVIDRSGSMHGSKLTFSVEAVRQSLKILNDSDSFSLSVFDSTVETLFAPHEVSPKFSAEIEKSLQKIIVGSSTALDAGLETGIDQAGELPRDANLVLLLSDGLANVGVTDLELIAARAKAARGSEITVSTIGVGLGYNEALMSVIALQGGGHFYHIENPGQIPAIISGELGDAANWAGKALEIRLTLPKGASAMALSEVYPITQSGNEVTMLIGNLPCDTSLEIPLRVSFPPQKPGARFQIEGVLNFTAPSEVNLTTPLNPVTLRIIDKSAFLPSSGVVEAVLSRVLQQRKIATLMNINQAMNISGRDADREESLSVRELREYASRLGEKRAEQELQELNARLLHVRGSSIQSKNAIYDSYRAMRGQKDFTNGKKD